VGEHVDDEQRRELEREVNLAAHWATQIIDAAHRMQACGVEEMWVHAIELHAAHVGTLIEDVRELFVDPGRTP
jgi:hypothetical protein